jgi:hypothetical protein
MHSQNISKIEPRVKPVVNTKGDTLIQIKLSDAKLLLQDVLEKQNCETTVTKLTELDSLRVTTITLQKDKIETLETKFNNNELRIGILENVIKNKDKELVLLNSIIEKQGREITKQKVFKIVGFSLALAIPITFLILHK